MILSRRSASLAAVLSAALSVAAHAGTIPYTVGYTPGTIVAPSVVVTANGGDIQGQFVGFINKGVPGLTDTIAIRDLTTNTTSPFVFNNKQTAVGTIYDFGTFAAGDVLDFEIGSAERIHFGVDNPATVYGSVGALNSDGQNHAYITSFKGGTIPGVYGDSATTPFQFMQGTFVGMEDLAINPTSNNGSTDYNDDSYIFTSVTGTTAATPEPSSLMLLGTGALTLAGAMRRRLAK